MRRFSKYFSMKKGLLIVVLLGLRSASASGITDLSFEEQNDLIYTLLIGTQSQVTIENNWRVRTLWLLLEGEPIQGASLYFDHAQNLNWTPSVKSRFVATQENDAFSITWTRVEPNSGRILRTGEAYFEPLPAKFGLSGKTLMTLSEKISPNLSIRPTTLITELDFARKVSNYLSKIKEPELSEKIQSFTKVLTR